MSFEPQQTEELEQTITLLRQKLADRQSSASMKSAMCRSEVGTEFLFQIVAERPKKAAVIPTTNPPFSEWTQVIPDAQLCKALLDRITDRAHIIETGTESYRFRRRPRIRRKEPKLCGVSDFRKSQATVPRVSLARNQEMPPVILSKAVVEVLSGVDAKEAIRSVESEHVVSGGEQEYRVYRINLL